MDSLQHHKQAFAHDTPFCKTFLEAVRQLKPTAIIGVWKVLGLRACLCAVDMFVCIKT